MYAAPLTHSTQQNKLSPFDTVTTYQMPVISLKDITSAEPKKAVEVAKKLFTDRRTEQHKTNTEFYRGNAWQNGKGWIGEIPSIALEGIAAFQMGLEKIRRGFVPDNVIAEIADRHAGGILGREVNWDFVSEDLFRLRRKKERDLPNKDALATQADEDLTGWWNEGRPKDKLKEALVIALNEERALLRFFIPKGLRDKDGKIATQGDIGSALNFLHVDVVYSDKGGVFVDSDTQQRFGVYVRETEEKATVIEVSWVENGITFLKILSDDPSLVEGPFTADLGGRLWMYELQRKPLITESICSLQRSINLNKTMMMRNVNLAGSRERYFLNVERPTETVRIKDDSPAGYHEEKRPLPGLPVGAGASVFLQGELITDKEGNVVDRADPNISITGPVDVTNFEKTDDRLYTSILRQAQQIHILISGDATASGRSREQARAEFESSLKLSKEVVDDAGRWMLETALRLAAYLCNKSAAYAKLRCDFNTIIETGPVSPEERTANRDDVKAGLLSKETAMSRSGVEDTDSEKARIEEDKAAEPAPVVIPPPVPKPLNGDSQLLQ